jgi:phosphoribosylglycinamide formyltransferase 2
MPAPFWACPFPRIECVEGASAVVLADKDGTHPTFTGVAEALSEPGVDVRIFGKPTTRPYRRMAVALAQGAQCVAACEGRGGQDQGRGLSAPAFNHHGYPRARV